ncbi:hypothetical protein Peur_064999 [Populus x canadensis]
MFFFLHGVPCNESGWQMLLLWLSIFLCPAYMQDITVNTFRRQNTKIEEQHRILVTLHDHGSKKAFPTPSLGSIKWSDFRAVGTERTILSPFTKEYRVLAADSGIRLFLEGSLRQNERPINSSKKFITSHEF